MVDLARLLQITPPLVESADDFGSDGLLGYARVLFEQDATQHSATIIELCEMSGRHGPQSKGDDVVGFGWLHRWPESGT